MGHARWGIAISEGSLNWRIRDFVTFKQIVFSEKIPMSACPATGFWRFGASHAQEL
jgi:hypothetical protein